MDGLLKAEWQEILGCTDEWVGKNLGVDDVAILGHNESARTQEQALTELLKGKAKPPLVEAPDFSKMKPIVVAGSDDEEPTTQFGSLQKIALGMSPFDMPIKKAATTAPEPVLNKGELHKRFGDSPKKLFRTFFQEQKSLGKTVSQTLDRFTDAAKSEYAEILAELSQEFA